MDNVKYKNLTSVQYAFAGACSGFVTRLTCQPLDVLKILFQLQVDPKYKSKYSSIIQSISVIIREEGVSALWKGHVPAQLLSVAYGAIQFSSYEKLMKLGNQFRTSTNENSVGFTGLHFYSGGLSGIIAISFTIPFDTIRTRLIAQQKLKLYKGLFDAGRQIWMREGFKGYFRGLIPACLQIAPSSGLVFGFKNIYTQLWNKCVGGLPDSYQITSKGHLITGLSAGITSKLIVYPMDVIKKRLQVQGMDTKTMCLRSVSNCGGFINCLLLLLKYEGVFGLYKGITPALIKSGVGNSINFTVYNDVCRFLDYLSR